MVCSLGQWRDLLALHTYPAGLDFATSTIGAIYNVVCSALFNVSYKVHTVYNSMYYRLGQWRDLLALNTYPAGLD